MTPLEVYGGLIVQIFFVVHDFLHSDMTQPVQEKKKGGGVYSLYTYIILYTPASFFLAQIESTHPSTTFRCQK